MITSHEFIAKPGVKRDILQIVRMYVIGWVFLTVTIPLMGYWL